MSLAEEFRQEWEQWEAQDNPFRSHKVLDKGFVRLDGAMADDLSVVNAARVSFARRSDLLDENGCGLIGFLMRERHGTPFEHNSMRFHVKCPMFVAREWFRHRIGSFNEWSARYSKMEAEFYVADYVRSQVGKPGAYAFEAVDDDTREEYRNTVEDAYNAAFTDYEHLIERGVAKELARAVLPVGIYTQFYWTANLRSVMNFLSLRNSDTAQYEIREYAKVIEAVVTELMPISMAAFVENGRVAP